MSSIPGTPSPASVWLDRMAPATAPKLDGAGSTELSQLLAPPQEQGPAVVGRGLLAGHTLAVGDGRARTQVMENAQQSRGFFKTLGLGATKVLAALVAVPLALGAFVLKSFGVLGAASRAKAKLDAKAERTYSNDPAIQRLKQAPAGGLMEGVNADPQLDAHSKAQKLTAKLVAHAQSLGTVVSRDEIIDMVNIGENIARTLKDSDGSLPLKLGDHEIKSSAYTARALGWYMMGKAGEQDLARPLGDTTSDMVTSGSMVMKDPGNRLYNFLSSCPSAGTRMSTHFAERVGHDKKHHVAGLFGTDKPAQRGIEDYQSKMPSKGGTMLFDKLKPDGNGQEELFVKFEGVGCPPYFKFEPEQSLGQKITGFFAAVDRNIGHSVSFLQSRASHTPSENQVVRMEHAYKGTFKAHYREFAALAKEAHEASVINDNAKAVGKSVHKFGLPFLKQWLEDTADAAVSNNQMQLANKCLSLLSSINAESRQLGLISDQYGIERRGAESHIAVF